jgi:hypothetical protein
METGRELFNSFLKRRPLSRPAFVPLVRGLMARVSGSTVEALTSDPTVWANGLIKTADLFDLDGIVAGFHFSLMAEACGCRVRWEADRPVLLPPDQGPCENPEASGRMKTALEAANRLFQVCRTNRACVAALTGPLTLVRHLLGDREDPQGLRAIKAFLVRVTEAFCALRPDVLIFMEGHWPGAGLDSKLHRIYQSLRNITSHYGVSPGLYVQGYRQDDLDTLSGLGLDIYILGPAENGAQPAIDRLWALGAQSLGVGLGLPVHDPEQAHLLIDDGLDYYRDHRQSGFFFTSFGPLTRQANPEVLHGLVKRIKGTVI